MKARIITDEDEDGQSETFLISCLERLRMRSLDGICRTVHIYDFQGSLRGALAPERRGLCCGEVGQ